MSQYTYIVHANWVNSLEKLNAIIENGDEDWPGLNTAEAIINIQYDRVSYLVFWRERKWLNKSECLQSGSTQE